jgi:anti-anti-sigma factor
MELTQRSVFGGGRDFAESERLRSIADNPVTAEIFERKFVRSSEMRPGSKQTASASKGAPRQMQLKKESKMSSASGAQGGAAIEVTSSGEWLAVEELRRVAANAAGEGRDVALSLKGVDYLDASAFQVLLALAEEQRKQAHGLRLIDASPTLRGWFEYAGAGQRFSFEEPGSGNA